MGVKGAAKRLAAEKRKLDAKELAEGIRGLERVGRNLSRGSVKSKAYELFRTGRRLHGSWRKAVEAQGIDYGEHIRRWMQSHRRGGKEELTKERLFNLIEDRWRGGSELNPRSRALGAAVSAAKRLFPPFAGSWRRAISEAAKAKGLIINYDAHVLKNVPGKWNKEKIKAEIRRLHDSDERLNENYAHEKHPRLLLAADYHYSSEGGWKAAVNDAGINYQAMLPKWHDMRSKAQQSPLRKPLQLGLALLDREAEVGGKLKYGHLKGLEKWVAFHGGMEKARALAERARQRLGENERLALALRAGDKAAEEALILKNAGFIKASAGRYSERIGFDDAVQLAKMGLLKGAERYDPTKGAKLVTYASQWVRKEIYEGTGGIFDNSTFRFPANVHREKGKIAKNAARLYAERGGRLGDEARERLLGNAKTAKRVKEIGAVVSLHQPVAAGRPEGKRLTFEDVKGIEDNTALSNVESGLVRRAIARLEAEDPRLATVVRRRFGIGTESGEPETLNAISRDLGITKERVRQLETDALKRLRKFV